MKGGHVVSVKLEEWTIEAARQSRTDGDVVALRYFSTEYDDDKEGLAPGELDMVGVDQSWEQTLNLEELRTLVAAGQAFLKLLDEVH